MNEMSEQDQIYRTSPGRTVKMMVIMLGICLAGGIIFFGMWDYWISIPPGVTASPQDHQTPAVATGKTVSVPLSFVESEDFRILTFNALPGEPDSNPTITISVGDKIEFDVVNDGISFHAFGVTEDDKGIAGIIPNTEIAAATNPLKGGESGKSEFIATKEGTYYYICTVPGHRAQGMEGIIIVTGAKEPIEAAAPTGISHNFELDFIESDDFRTLAFNALPGETGNNPNFTVNSGDEVTFTTTNAGVSFHSFGIVSDPSDFNNILWDSAIAAATNPLKAGESGTVTFNAGAPGEYYYICTVPGHAVQGMKGSFIVE
ncbi:MAG: Blue (Type1) copper domain-containing protein [Cenarchaeum symbiont of Oopsacas minuta]|nr:Blue (Type1) copper domain-containing protein [Cenarchaeum symbiont of Oopsacas minuta]